MEPICCHNTRTLEGGPTRIVAIKRLEYRSRIRLGHRKAGFRQFVMETSKESTNCRNNADSTYMKQSQSIIYSSGCRDLTLIWFTINCTTIDAWHDEPIFWRLCHDCRPIEGTYLTVYCCAVLSMNLTPRTPRSVFVARLGSLMPPISLDALIVCAYTRAFCLHVAVPRKSTLISSWKWSLTVVVNSHNM